MSPSLFQHHCHQHFHKDGRSFPCRLGCPDTWFRKQSSQTDHHVQAHGTLFSDAARARGHDPRLYTGIIIVKLLRVWGQRRWIDDAGKKRRCANCRCEGAGHWQTLDPGLLAQCQPCGDYYRRKGRFRPTNMPIRGRALPPARQAVRDAPCHCCGRAPGRSPHWGRGPLREILCSACRKACESQSPPCLVPRICANDECLSQRSSLWVGGVCGACYSYAYKNDGAQRPKSVVDQ